MNKVPYKEYLEAISNAQAKIGTRVLLSDRGGSFGYPVDMGVNWMACGTVSAEEAAAFAAEVASAAKAAKEFPYNGDLIDC